MSVVRSHKNVACQLVDDENGVTLVSASTQDKALSGDVAYGGNCDAAKAVGKAVAEKALAAGIKRVRFDRGHLKYHGRVAALADAAREAGLELREDVETVLVPGMVVSMEPMLTIPEGQAGAGGYREHDILVITEEGAENITGYPYGPGFNVVG